MEVNVEELNDVPQHFSHGVNDRVLEVPTDMLKPHPLQPRKNFDPAAMEELKASIASLGILTPLLIMEDRQGLWIISGERRWRAAQELGIKTVPCLVIKQQIGALLMVGANSQKRLTVYERATAAMVYIRDAYNYAFGQEATLEDWGNFLRYIDNPKGAKVPPPPNWVLEHFPAIQSELPQVLQPFGFTLSEMAAFQATLANLHPLVVEALEAGETYWDAARRFSPWIKKVRKAFPEHPELTEENIREFIRLVGRKPQRDISKILADEWARLAGANRTRGTTKNLYAYFKRVYKQSGRLPDEESRKKAQQLTLNIEGLLRELEQIYAQHQIPMTAPRKKIS